MLLRALCGSIFFVFFVVTLRDLRGSIFIMKNLLLETYSSIRDNRYTQLFLIVFFIGAFLRFWGIWNIENTDEYNEVFEALRVASGHFNTTRWIKKCYQNILAIEYGIYFVIGWVLNIFKNPMHFASIIIQDLNPLFIIGRITTATLGTLSLLLIYMIGSKCYNRKTALIATVFMSILPVHVWTSHLVGTDVPMTFFALLSLYFIINIYLKGELKYYILSTFFAAVAINTKILASSICIPFLAAHFLNIRARYNGKYYKFIFSKEVFLSATSFIIGYILSNPVILTAFKNFIKSFLWRANLYNNTIGSVSYSQNAYIDYIKILFFKQFYPPLFILIFAGLLYALYKRNKSDCILTPFILFHYFLISGTNYLVQDRYIIPILPVLLLLGSRLLIEIFDNAKIKGKIFTYSVYSSVLILLILLPLIKTVRFDLTLTDRNTGVIAKEWIERNITPGSKILIDAGRTIITSGPRLSQCRDNLMNTVHKIKQLKEGEILHGNIESQIVDSYSAIYFELLLDNMPEITYDLTYSGLGRDLEALDYYKNNGFEYIITNGSTRWNAKRPAWRKKYPKSASFYDSLDRELELIKVFMPNLTRSGSTIKIYKIDHD